MIDKLIFWSHYVLKQLIGRLLLCSVRHIMVNCLRNADCRKVSPLSGTWCDLCFVNTRVPVTWIPGNWAGKANRLLFRDVHGELKISECITCGVCKTNFHNDFYSCSGAYTHFQTLFLFSLFIYHSFHVWPNWFSTVCILQFAVNEVASMAAILVTFVTVISLGTKNPCLC